MRNANIYNFNFKNYKHRIIKKLIFKLCALTDQRRQLRRPLGHVPSARPPCCHRWASPACPPPRSRKPSIAHLGCRGAFRSRRCAPTGRRRASIVRHQAPCRSRQWRVLRCYSRWGDAPEGHRADGGCPQPPTSPFYGSEPRLPLVETQATPAAFKGEKIKAYLLYSMHR